MTSKYTSQCKISLIGRPQLRRNYVGQPGKFFTYEARVVAA